MSKPLYEIVFPDQSPRGRGRPALPQDAQKVKINITIDRDLLEWIDQHGKNRSRFINKLLKDAHAPRE